MQVSDTIGLKKEQREQFSISLLPLPVAFQTISLPLDFRREQKDPLSLSVVLF